MKTVIASYNLQEVDLIISEILYKNQGGTTVLVCAFFINRLTGKKILRLWINFEIQKKFR